MLVPLLFFAQIGICGEIQLVAQSIAQPVVEATKITLSGTMSLEEAITRINAQSGNQLVDFREQFGQRKDRIEITAKWKDLAFWQVVDELADQANFRVLPSMTVQGKRVVGVLGPEVRGAKVVRPHTSYTGPMRLTIKQVNAHRNFAMPSLSHMALTVEAACEPRLQPLFLTLDSGSFQAFDQNGELPAFGTSGRGQIRMLGEVVELPIRLTLPTREQKVLKELRGQFLVSVPPRTVSLQLPLTIGSRVQEPEDVAATLTELGTGTKRWKAVTHLLYPTPTEARGLNMESHQTWMMEGVRAELRHATKAVWKATGEPLIAVDGRGARLEFGFDVGSPTAASDWMLRLEVPATPVQLPVKFTFAQIPLP